MRYLKYILVVAASLALLACGNKSSTATGTGVISLKGGDGGTTAGGDGGRITTGTVFGDLKF
ncbi:MAG TPA: hypothetical protein VEM32_03495, partial [Geobacteraceae bacterium]|nr:hypothetical protein [Geobacteraceae bacterium]